MRFPKSVFAHLSRMALPLAFAITLAGCSTSPTSGRTQFNILPGELETTVPDLRFGAKTLLVSGGEYCREDENPCPGREAAEKLAQRIAPIAERLGTTAAQLSPELVSRIPQVEVFVVPGDTPAVSSSAGGRIAVGAGLARFELTDTDLAFALAREFGRLAAAHHRESTSAGLAVSLVVGSPLTSAYLATSILADIVFPMGALAKIGISLLASMGTEQLVEASQQDEADEFAGKLMLAAGYDLRELAAPRPGSPQGVLQVGWLPSYFVSRAKVAAPAQPDPWPDEAPPSIALATAPDPWPDEAPTPIALATAPDPWPDEAPPSFALAKAPDPWPDEAHEPPESPVVPLKTVPVAIARIAAPGPDAGEMRKLRETLPKVGAATALDAKKPAVKKTKRKVRKSKTRTKKRP